MRSPTSVRPLPAAVRATALTLVLTLGPMLALASCSGAGDPPDETAAALAAALQRGRLPADLFQDGSPQPAYDDLTAGLGEVRPTVDVGAVSEQDQTATAALTWAWDLGAQRWRYESRARLVEGDQGWRVRWEPALVEPSLGAGEALEVSTTPAVRGDVLGAGGARLVTERPVVHYGIDKTKVSARRWSRSATRAAQLLGVSPRPFVRAMRAAGPEAFVEAIVLRPADARDVDPAYDDIRGAVALRGTLPLAPTREFTAPLLGRVGPVTAELVEASEGRLRAGDVSGLSGLQQRYDEQLAGMPGLTVSAVDGTGHGDGRRELFAADPVPGRPLRTTLDLRLQSRAERVLADPDPRGDDGAPGPAAALVAIRPSTGAVLAAASGPGAGGQNIATFGQYTPGSTFKVVTTLALLRSGLTPDSPVSCPATTVVDGKRFKNYDDYPASGLGRITLREAVANSCNTAFVGSRRRVSGSELADAAASLGFGEDHDVGFPAYFGQVPEPTGETEAAADLIGQGKVLASPMAMATVAASVASGRTVVPRLVDGDTPKADPRTPLTRSEAATLRSLMRSVVTDGSGAVLAGLPGRVGAKTGTAEYGEPGAGGALSAHAWMIAFRGDLAVAAFVETGESGSSTAGPLLERFLS